MAPLETAISELRQLLSSDTAAPEWRWLVRRRLADVRAALDDPQLRMGEAWLAARERTSNRRRHQLQARVSSLAASVLGRLDAEGVRGETRRLLGDLEHYVQRLHDLVYDSVSLEIGGSE